MARMQGVRPGAAHDSGGHCLDGHHHYHQQRHLHNAPPPHNHYLQFSSSFQAICSFSILLLLFVKYSCFSLDLLSFPFDWFGPLSETLLLVKFSSLSSIACSFLNQSSLIRLVCSSFSKSLLSLSSARVDSRGHRLRLI